MSTTAFAIVLLVGLAFAVAALGLSACGLVAAGAVFGIAAVVHFRCPPPGPS